MNPTVTQFYAKNPEEDYGGTYDQQHGPRLDELVAHYNLRETLAGKRVVDVGGGLGFLGKRLGSGVEYWVIDGAEIIPEMRVTNGTWLKADLDHSPFGDDTGSTPYKCVNGERLISCYGDVVVASSESPVTALKCFEVPRFDAAFCLETIEHCGNPHHVLVEIKRLVKPSGDVYLSIPTETVWHNAPYPALLWPPRNFAQFLGQMALPIVDAYTYQPQGPGWPAYTFKCRNAPWSEKRLLFPKQEAKFRDCTPLEATNL